MFLISTNELRDEIQAINSKSDQHCRHFKRAQRRTSNVGSRQNETILVTLALEQSISFHLHETKGLENRGRILSQKEFSRRTYFGGAGGENPLRS